MLDLDIYILQFTNSPIKTYNQQRKIFFRFVAYFIFFIYLCKVKGKWLFSPFFPVSNSLI